MRAFFSRFFLLTKKLFKIIHFSYFILSSFALSTSTCKVSLTSGSNYFSGEVRFLAVSDALVLRSLYYSLFQSLIAVAALKESTFSESFL